MRILIQIALMFAVCIIGTALSSVIPISIPPSVISMIILFVLLTAGIMKVKHINELSDFLLSHMAFFFVPAGVGLIESFHLFSDKLLRLLAVCTINTLITFLVTAYTVTLVSKLIQRRKKQ